MNINETYLKFLQKVNKNFTNDNIVVDKGRFVYLYREAENKFIEWTLEKRNEDDVQDVERLLVLDKPLQLERTHLNHYDFKIPEDFFSFSNVQAYATSSQCRNKKIHVFPVKTENIEEILADEDNKPSFKYREAPYTIGNGTINIYTDNFEISRTYLTYYRYPRQVDIEGYIKADGTMSTNIDSEFDDRVVDRILSIAAKEFNTNEENLQKVQFDKDRAFSRT